MSGKSIEFGIRITSDGRVAVVEHEKVRASLAGVGKEGEAAYRQIEEAAAKASKAAGDANARVGKSASEAAFAMRMLPAQMTDVAVGLSSGQSPFMVLIQQGGQLKDMFGGIGPAARAVGGYVSGLVNPFTVAATAALGLAYAYEKGRAESDAMARSIILSGNATGTTVGQLQAYARTLSATTGASRGALSETMSLAVASGKVSSDMLAKVTEAAVRMERVGGAAASETVAQFAELGKAPVEASRKLDDQMNYLTISIFRQIKALQEQGDTAGAAALAQSAFADALLDRAPKMEENLGVLQRLWRSLGDDVARVARVFTEIGTGGTEKELASAQERVKSIRERMDAMRSGGADGSLYFKFQEALLKTAEAELVAVQKKSAAEKSAAEQAGASADAKLRAKTADDDIAKSVAHQLTILRAQADLIAENGKNTPEKTARLREIDAQIAALDGSLARIDGRLALTEAKLAAARSHTASLGALGQLSDRQVVARQAEIEAADISAKIGALEQKRALSTNEAAVNLNAEIAVLEVQRVALRQQTADKLAEIDASSARDRLAIEATAAKQRGDLVGAYELDWVAKNELKVKKAYAENNQAVIAQMREQFLAGLDDSSFQVAKAKFEALFSDLQARLDAVRLAAEADGGVFAALGADRQAEAIKKEFIPALREARAEMERAAKTSPINAKAVNDAGREVESVAAEISPFWRDFYRDMHQGITSELMRQAGTDGKNYGKALGDGIQAYAKTATIKIPVQFAGDLVVGAVKGVVSAAGSAIGSAAGIGNLASFGNSAASMIGLSELPSFGTAISNVGTAWSTFSTMMAEGTGLMEAGSAALAGMGSSFAAIAGPIGLGLFAANALGLFGSGGGPKTEGTSFANFAGGKFSGYSNTSITGEHGQTSDGADATVQQILGTMAQSFANLASQLGGDASRVQIGLGFSTDPQGSAPDNIGGDVYNTTTGQRIYRHVWDAGRGDYAQALAAESQRVTLAALQQASLDQWAADIVDAVDAVSATDADITAALNRLQTMQQLKPMFDAMGVSIENVSQSMIDAMGGAQAAASQISSYFDNFYSDAERLAVMQGRLNEEFARLGFAVPTTEAGFRALASALDMASEADRRKFASLMSMQGMFHQTLDLAAQVTAATTQASAAALQAANDEVARRESDLRSAYQAQASALQDTAQRFRATATNLRAASQAMLVGQYSPLGPIDRLAAARDAFDSALRRAKLNDPDAQSQLDQLGQQLMAASQAVNGSSQQAAADFMYVRQSMEEVATVADRQADVATQQLDELRSQVSALITLNDSVLTVRDAIQALQQARQGAQSAQVAQTLASGTIAQGIGSFGAAAGTWVGPAGEIYNAANDRWVNQYGRSASGAELAANSRAMFQAQGGEATLAAWRATGLSLAAFNQANSLPAGTAEEFARAHNISLFAAGTGAGTTSGLFGAGERGTELIYSPHPVRVLSNQDTRAAVIEGGQVSRQLADNAAALQSIAGRLDRLIAAVEAGQEISVTEARLLRQHIGTALSSALRNAA